MIDDMAVYIANLGKYNEGYLVGAWFTFPIDEEDVNQAIRWEYIDTNKRNPASLATLPKIPKTRRKVWSVQTFREAVKATEDDLLSICMHLAFSCSMRIGEITGLTWEDVIIDEESIATVSTNTPAKRIRYRITLSENRNATCTQSW